MSETDITIIGCGYIGKKVAARLQRQSYHPLCLVHSEASASQCESLGVPAYCFDLDKSDPGLPDEFAQRFAKSRMVYFCPPPPKGKTDSRMAHFIAALEKLGAVPKQILLISTTGVYGDCNGEWIDEARIVNPQADRAFRRVDAEQQLTAYCEKYKVNAIIFRVPGIYAADKLPVKRISSGEPVVSAADSGFTNRIHAQDLSAFCAEALVSDLPGGIYNCCDGHPSTMNDYFMGVADALGIERPGEISLQQAQQELSSGMLSYLAESKRISNKKLLTNFKTQLQYPSLASGLENIEKHNE